jgi:Fungal N-terminal domain of STAND proteins
MAADPFSIFATVSGLVALSASVAKQVYSVAADVKGAPQGIDSLSKEVDGMALVLNRLEASLKDDFNKTYPFSLGSTNDLRPVLKNCRDVLEGIDKKLEKYKKEKLLDRIMFVFSDKDFAKLRRALEAHKQTLSITLILLAEYVLTLATFQHPAVSDLSC